MSGLIVGSARNDTSIRILDDRLCFVSYVSVDMYDNTPPVPWSGKVMTFLLRKYPYFPLCVWKQWSCIQHLKISPLCYIGR